MSSTRNPRSRWWSNRVVTLRHGVNPPAPTPWRAFEALEPRRLLVSWDGGGGDSLWLNAANWSGNALPGVNDDVVINGAAVEVYLTGGGTRTCRSLTLVNSDLTLEETSLSLTGGVSAPAVRLQASMDAELTVQGASITASTTSFTNASLELSNGDLVGGTGILTDSYLDLGTAGTGDFILRGTSVLQGEVNDESTLTIQGVTGKPAVVYWIERLINAGTITLTSTAAVDASLRPIGPVINSGTLNFNAGVGGARRLTGGLLNVTGFGAGAVNINATTVFAGPNASYTNLGGTIAIGAGRTLTIAGPNAVLEQESGTLAIAGALLMTGSRGTLEYLGGTITGSPVIVAGTLSLGATATGAASFILRGGSTLAGNVRPGQTVTVQGVSGLGARLTWVTGLSNTGTLTLTSVGAASPAILVADNGPILNSGTINIQAGTGGIRRLVGGLTNAGNLNLNAPTTLAPGDEPVRLVSGQVTGSGSLTIAGDLRWEAGAIGGTGALTVWSTGALTTAGAGAKTLARALSNAGAVTVEQGTLTLAGTVAQLTSGLLVGGAWTIGAGATLNLPASVAAIGSLARVELQGAGAACADLLNLRRNEGALTLGDGCTLTLTPTGGVFTNAGRLRLDAGATLSITSAGAGAFTQAASGFLDIGIRALGSANMGRILSAGGATLGGTLLGAYAPGFTPASGSLFQFITSATRAGAFAVVFLPSPPTTALQYLATGARFMVP